MSGNGCLWESKMTRLSVRLLLEQSQIIADACKVLTELRGDSIEEVDLLEVTVGRYGEFAKWPARDSRVFHEYCQAAPEAIFRIGQTLDVDVLPIVRLFHLARAQTEYGLEVQPTSEDSEKYFTAWAQLRFAARLGNSTSPASKGVDDVDDARKQRGFDLWNAGRTWPQIAEELNGAADDFRAVRSEIVRWAAKNGMTLAKRSGGRKPKK